MSRHGIVIKNWQGINIIHVTVISEVLSHKYKVENMWSFYVRFKRNKNVCHLQHPKHEGNRKVLLNDWTCHSHPNNGKLLYKILTGKSITFWLSSSDIILFVFWSQQLREWLKNPRVESKATMTSPYLSWTKTKVSKTLQAFCQQNLIKSSFKWEKRPHAQGVKMLLNNAVVLDMSGTKKYHIFSPRPYSSET